MVNKHLKQCSISLFTREMKNQNHSRIPLHTHEDGYNKKEISVSKNVEKLDPSYIR